MKWFDERKGHCEAWTSEGQRRGAISRCFNKGIVLRKGHLICGLHHRKLKKEGVLRLVNLENDDVPGFILTVKEKERKKDESN